MAIYGFDPLPWYDELFSPRRRPMRFWGNNHKERWGFLPDQVDWAVIEMVEGLARGNRRRVFARLKEAGHRRKITMSENVMYRCLDGEMVGEGVAIDFETLVSEWIAEPNFDAPPCPPPSKPDELGQWIKDYVGTRKWVGDQLGLRDSDIANALAGRSARHFQVVLEFAQDFYARRVGLDVRNENYENELQIYKAARYHHALSCYVTARRLFEQACEAWLSSDAKHHLEREIARGGDRWEVWGRMNRQGFDVVMETHTFRSWCDANKDLIWREATAHVPTKPEEWRRAYHPIRVNPPPVAALESA